MNRLRTVSIAGSPSAHSRSSWLIELAQTQFRRAGARGTSIRVSELPAGPLLLADKTDPQLRSAVAQVLEADVVIVATPIYKAAYSGLLKAFLDLLPQDGLRDKTVLPLATGGSIAHLLALDYALKPVLSALGARDILDPVFATDAQIIKHPTLGYAPLPEVALRVESALQILIDRAEEFERSEEAARERDELLAHLQPKLPAPSVNPEPWAARDVRWSV